LKKIKKNSNTIYCNDIELIIDYIVENTEYSRKEIRDIVDAQFRMLKETTKSGGLITPESNFEDFKSIRLIRLGSFKPSEKKFENIKKIIKEKNV
jgi:nucleoid DNA-binding protein